MSTTTATPAELAERDLFITAWNGGEGAAFAAANPTFDEMSEADQITAIASWPAFDRWKKWIQDGIENARDHIRALLLLDFALNWWFGPGGPGHGGVL